MPIAESYQIGAIQRHRIMVIGSNVNTVQRVSRYCLKQGAEVFPYYGFPTAEEVTLFDPKVSVLCLPGAENFLNQTDRPYILWSEQLVDIGLPLVSTKRELETSLQEIFQD